MGNARAQYVRRVLPHERMDDLVEEAKGLTYEHYCEFALLELEDRSRALVRGGAFGIELECSTSNDPFGRPADQVYVEIEGAMTRVARLIFHTHPKPTGPSDDDLTVLRLLGQDRSMLYELFGPPEGTVIRPKER